MRLLEILNDRKKPTPLKDVAQAAGLNKVTTHRLLRSLCKSGVVQMIGDNGHYALGPAVLTFAEGFRKSFTIRDRVLPYLEKLAISQETAIFCERYGHSACVTVETWDSPHDTRMFSGTGVVRPLTAGSSALAILAMLPENEISSIIDPNNSLEQPSLTLSKRKQLLDKIKAIKTLGYAVSMRERDLDTGGIAAPVFDYPRFGSLAVIGPVDRMERNGIGRIGKQVQIIANQLTAELVSSTKNLSSELKRTAR